MFCVECLKQGRYTEAEMVRGRVYSDSAGKFVPYKGKLCKGHQDLILSGNYKVTAIKTPELSKSQKQVLQQLALNQIEFKEYPAQGSINSWAINNVGTHYRTGEILKEKGYIEIALKEDNPRINYYRVTELGKRVLAK